MDACPASAYPDWQTSAYVLPYPVGRAYPVLQGNCGPFSHIPGTPDQYAYDFTMPIGHNVVAARAGRVHKLEERYVDGDNEPGHENGVIVDHGDGTYARYLHFTLDGVLVELNDQVQAGDLLGRSGHTGFSTQPHLHFDVLTDCTGETCRPVPVTFRNTSANPGGLRVGNIYQAEPF